MMNRIPIGLEVGVRFIMRVLLVATVVAAAALALLLIAPKVVGGQSLSILSGSMAPVVDTGDMVTILPQKAEDVKVGQIVAFNDPNGSGKLYQHRVQFVGESNGQIQVVTKGDANGTGEKWQTPIGSDVGKVVMVTPKLGYVIATLTGGKPIEVGGRNIPIGTVLIVILMVLVGLVVIVGILRSPGDKDTDLDFHIFDGELSPEAEQAASPVPGAPGHINSQQEGPTHA